MLDIGTGRTLLPEGIGRPRRGRNPRREHKGPKMARTLSSAAWRVKAKGSRSPVLETRVVPGQHCLVPTVIGGTGREPAIFPVLLFERPTYCPA